MANLNRTRGLLFISHPGTAERPVNCFHFTADDQGFFENDLNHAQVHAAEIKKQFGTGSGTPETIGREEYNAWWPEYCISYAKECADNVGAAQAKLDEAKAAAAGLTGKKDAGKLAEYNRVINAAQKELDLATARSVNATEAAKPFLKISPEYQAVLDANQRSLNAQTALGDANVEMNAANQAQADLPTDATGGQKAVVTKRINKAKATLELATMEYNDALVAADEAAIAYEATKK